MNLIEKYNCILCKYNQYNKDKQYGCYDYQEKDKFGYPIVKCGSLTNIYYGTIVKIFPFKQIDDFFMEKSFRKKEEYNKKMEEKYGDYSLENDDVKFIWGISEDLPAHDACLYTANDIEIIYDKKKRQYELGIETAYGFHDYVDECNYLRSCLKAFTQYMDDNGLNKDTPFSLFFNNPSTSTTARTIEELYTNFKIFVDGFCIQEQRMVESSEKHRKMKENI